ncbi:hypothetical protein B0H14DRAFT_2210430, partial [Mycena olivaceomarginata]
KEFGRLEWATCVEHFMDFEKRSGYEDGSQITADGRPDVVKRWLARQRRWDVKQDVGTLGSESMEGTFVSSWWKWWMGVQPADRRQSGALSRPADLDWGVVMKLHGRNGLLQVMATLLWWGEALVVTVVTMSPFERMAWVFTVEDVTWVLEEIL